MFIDVYRIMFLWWAFNLKCIKELLVQILFNKISLNVKVKKIIYKKFTTKRVCLNEYVFAGKFLIVLV